MWGGTIIEMGQSESDHMHTRPIEFEQLRYQCWVGLDHCGQRLRCPAKRREQITRH